jgi:hypothetical protein
MQVGKEVTFPEEDSCVRVFVVRGRKRASEMRCWFFFADLNGLASSLRAMCVAVEQDEIVRNRAG